MHDHQTSSIPFNRPLLLGTESSEVVRAIDSGNLEGDGVYTSQCADWLSKATGTKQALLTPSCTDALEICAILCNFKPGDQVILPSYTFVSTASAFLMHGADIVWCDVRSDTKNLDERQVESLITERTKAVVAVHYGGVACEMDALIDICTRHNVVLIEDAAQAIDCEYKGLALGALGQLGTLSFHATKNIHCGEGGALLVNEDRFMDRSLIIRDKGTNRSQFRRGLVSKYTWVDLGSSFLMSELQAAFLSQQLAGVSTVNDRRRSLWERYDRALRSVFDEDQLPHVPSDCRHNGHLYYVVSRSVEAREKMAAFLARHGITAHFHYVPLHRAPIWKGRYDNLSLPVTQFVSDGLLRLPLYYDLGDSEVDRICEALADFAKRN